MSAPNPVPQETTGPTATDRNVFDMLFGPKTCAPRGHIVGMYIAFAVVATAAFLLLAYIPMGGRALTGKMNNPNAVLGFKALIFFFVAWLLVWLFQYWFRSHPMCDEK